MGVPTTAQAFSNANALATTPDSMAALNSAIEQAIASLQQGNSIPGTGMNNGEFGITNADIAALVSQAFAAAHSNNGISTMGSPSNIGSMFGNSTDGYSGAPTGTNNVTGQTGQAAGPGTGIGPDGSTNFSGLAARSGGEEGEGSGATPGGAGAGPGGGPGGPGGTGGGVGGGGVGGPSNGGTGGSPSSGAGDGGGAGGSTVLVTWLNGRGHRGVPDSVRDGYNDLRENFLTAFPKTGPMAVKRYMVQSRRVLDHIDRLPPEEQTQWEDRVFQTVVGNSGRFDSTDMHGVPARLRDTLVELSRKFGVPIPPNAERYGAEWE
jgi:hypothetical protein